MTQASRLSATQLSFTSDGTDVNARITASDDTLTLFGTSGVSNRVTISNVQDPSLGQDAATKAYVDGLVVSGVTWKNAARLATSGIEIQTFVYDGTSVITVSGGDEIDGIPVVDGDRILMKDMAALTTTGSTNPTFGNGLYVVSNVVVDTSFTLTRTTDATNGDVANGSAVFIYNGDLVSPFNNDTTWVVSDDTAVTWGQVVTFVQMSAAPALGPIVQDHLFVGNDDGDAKDAGANLTFDFSTGATAPVFSIGADGSAANTSSVFNLGTSSSGAAVASTINMGFGTGASTINMASTSGASTINSSGSGLLTISTGGAYTSTANASSTVSLFNTTTSGNISMGTSLIGGTLTLGGGASQTGSTIIDNAGTLELGSVNSTDINIGSANASTIDMDGVTILLGSVTNSTSTTITGQDMNVGSATTTTTSVDGISIDVGSSVTTSLDLLATGTNGIVNIASGVGGTNTAGGEIDITAGAGDGTGAGGSVDINAGAAGATGVGGSITIDAGGSTVGTGGAISLTSGIAATTGAGGAINITSSAGVGTAQNGGDITITAGLASDGSGTAGLVKVVSGTTTTAANFTFPIVQGSLNDVLTTDALGNTSWTTPGGASMLALPEFRMYVGNNSGTASVATNNLTYDDTTTAGTPILSLGAAATGLTTMNIGSSTNTLAITVGSTSGDSMKIQNTHYNSFLEFGPDTTLDMNAGTFKIDDGAINSITIDGIGNISAPNTNLTLSSDVNDVLLSSGSVIFTKSGGVMTSDSLMTLSSTSADLTLSTTTSGNVVIEAANQSGTPAEATGSILDISTQTFTDNNTVASGTAAFMSFSTFAAPTLESTNTSVTTTDAATLYLAGGPVNGVNNTATNSWAIYIDDTTGTGNVFIGGDLTVGGAFIQPLATDNFLIGGGSGNAEASGADFTFVASGADNILNVGTSTVNENGTLVLANAGGTGTSTITMNGDAIVMNGEGASTVSLFATPTGAVDMFASTTGTIDMGSSTAGAMTINNGAVMTLAANSTSLIIGSATSTTTALEGTIVNIGLLATTVSVGDNSVTTANLDAATVNVGSNATTAVNVGASGAGTMIIDSGSSITMGTTSTSTSITSAGASSVNSTSADLTLSTTTSGNIVINAANQTVTNSSSGTALDVTAQTLTVGAAQANISATTFQAPTFAGEFTVTDASTVYIASAPLPGTSTLTNSWALHVASGDVKVNDEVYATAFNAVSDARYKTNISELHDPLAQINKIEGYSYNWKEDFVGYNDKLQYGVLAQQLEEAGLEHLVAGTNESKAVNYMGLIPLLIGAVKELSSKVDKQTRTRDRSGW